MNAEELEQRILQIWMTTRIPLTRANLQYLTKVPRKKLDDWLKQLAVDGVVDVDVDAEGEMTWRVLGASRPSSGPQSIAEAEKLDKLGKEIGAAKNALVLASKAAGLTTQGGEGKKSIIASGALSFFFGPLGWLYAAPLREAAPAAVLYIILWSLLPKFILLPILGVAAPIMAIAGMGYAWRYNQKGERTPLLPPKSEKT